MYVYRNLDGLIIFVSMWNNFHLIAQLVGSLIGISYGLNGQRYKVYDLENESTLVLLLY